MTQEDILSLEEICVTVEFTGSIEVVTYPQTLLATCKGFIKDRHYGISVVVAHMACEVSTERTLSAAFASKGLQNLEDPIFKFFNGYNLANERIRKLYTALTGDDIEHRSFWQAFKESTERRNKIVHRGIRIGQEEADSSYQATSDFVSYLSDFVSRLKE